jgi:hypothetical protein
LLCWCLETPLITILMPFFFHKKNSFVSFSKCFIAKTWPNLCLSFIFLALPPTPWSQTAACYRELVPIISIYLRHKQSCGKPQKLALLAQLTSTLLRRIPSYHIAHPSPCHYRYVEPLICLQGASKSGASFMRNKIFIRHNVNKLGMSMLILILFFFWHRVAIGSYRRFGGEDI